MTTAATNEKTLNLKWIYLAWVGIIFSSLVIGTVSAVLQGPPEPISAKVGLSNFTFFAITLYSLGTVVSVVILYFLLRSRGMSLRSVGLTGGISKKGVLYALLGLAVGILLYGGIEVIVESLGIHMFWRGAGSSTPKWITAFDLTLVVSFAVIIGPIVEEMIFRGYVVSALRQTKLTILAVYVLSAVIFASVHIFIGLGAMIFIFFWSFIPTFLFLKFNSLYPGILFHVLNNVFAYVAAPMWLS
jgi:membrane protease YdiL (CAAX protease family)